MLSPTQEVDDIILGEGRLQVPSDLLFFFSLNCGVAK